MTRISRRRFMTLAGATAVVGRFATPTRTGQAGLTVQDVMARVQQALGGTAPATSADGLKAGRPDLLVTGIATAPIATVEIIRRAKAAGCNLIVTCEPTFYSRADQPSPANRQSDPTFAAKRALIVQSDVAIWRLRDQWLAQRPSSLIDGFAGDLQWQRYQQPGSPSQVVIPALTLRDLVAHVQQRLAARALRVVGQPELRVSRIVLSPGPSAAAVTFSNLASNDVIVAGDPREWEGVEYVQDAITAGQPKAIVTVGRLLSENGGMRVMAAWLGETLPGVRIAPLTVTDPVLEARSMTAGEIVDRIKQALASSGVSWRAETVDTFKAGKPETPVSGIATTFMATFDAIQRAVAAGANFVITHEPTFYNHQDATTAFADDAVFKAKMAFIEKHQVVVFRFHDHWHAKRPDGMRVALFRLFGWPDAPGVVTLPPTTLNALATDLRKRLDIRAMRVVGDPAARVSRVALGLGYGNPQLSADVDVVITGEYQESDSPWDNPAYALDATATGQPKGVILLGHEQSEGPGMDECATWLHTVVPDVRVSFIRAGEPFWAPG